jgi:hypothetical protein
MAADRKAQEARAKQIREDIKKMARGRKPQPESEKVDEVAANDAPAPKASTPKRESPRDFVHRRMRELDQEDKT